MYRKSRIKAYISASVLVFTLLLLIGLFVFNIPEANKDLVNILLGAVIGWNGSVISYYFGSMDKGNQPNE